MKNKIHHSALYVLYLCLLFSALCAFRAITSIGIGVLFAASLTANQLYHRRFRTGVPVIFLISCAAFVVLQVTALLYTSHQAAGLRHVLLKSSMLFIPLSFYAYPYINKQRFHTLMTHYCWLLSGVLLYCLIVAFIKYFFHHLSIDVFFYHGLVAPFRHHAIHFSILAFAGIIFLIETAHHGQYSINRFVHIGMLAFLTGCLLLLASKLVISFLALYLLLLLISQTKRNTLAIAGLLITGLVLFTPNPVNSRFRDLLHGNISLIEQTSFTPSNYFNGLQFRLLQWRFTAEILHARHAWLLGVSPADAQPLLDQKYISTHMYTGQQGRPGNGFLGANAHNEFLEALLQTGIPGLVCFIVICAGMVGMAVQQKSRALSMLVALLICYSFTESVLETQYGIFIFTFLPLLFYTGTRD